MYIGIFHKGNSSESNREERGVRNEHALRKGGEKDMKKKKKKRSIVTVEENMKKEKNEGCTVDLLL